MPTNPSGVGCTGTKAGGILRTSAPIIHCPATGRWICEDTDYGDKRGNCLVWAPLGSGPAHQPLPAELGWKILRNQFVIEEPQLLDIRALVAFGIKVVRIESSNPLEHFLVPAVHEVLIFPFAVRRIEGVIANHVKGLRRQVIFDDVIQVFVMAPGEMNVFQAAAFRVDAGSSLVFRLAAVGIVGKQLMKDDLVRIGAAYWKRIADHGPLRLSVKT